MWRVQLRPAFLLVNVIWELEYKPPKADLGEGMDSNFEKTELTSQKSDCN